MKWTLILNDGSRHEIEADVRFRVLGSRKVVDATADGSQLALFDAFNAAEVILESSTGQQHTVTIESISNGVARIVGV